ncbi:unnamed protein product [Spirodela intermedia]|uniref:Uncharacterized protein n=1 Tax=Spirodela intermedia TaxID=51605 RepID=A0A7I8JLY0_SPIIN|nr:unnamed protein product [Spirodela intermedia]CAA6670573.1 unnamed protein product [Spirodela intermedia]
MEAVAELTAPASTAHILFVTFTGQGHLNPFLRFAKSVAAKGADVTFSSVADAGSRIREATKSSPAAAAAADGTFIPLGAGRIRFEFFSDGWEVGDPRRYELDLYMPQLRDVGSKEVAALIRRQADLGRPVACVVGNPFIPWVLGVAAGMGIPRAVLWVQSAAVFSAYYHYQKGLAEFPSDAGQDVSMVLPGSPPCDGTRCPRSSSRQPLPLPHQADWVFLNTFEEIESASIEGISQYLPVIPVGPLVDLPVTEAVRGDLWKAADCVGWLDAQEPGSVVYASVGSVVVLSAEVVVELAEGLRGSGQPFLWVVRNDARAMLPEGFEEEVAGRGLVVQWSPQETVLRHPSTACFLTHCGWNSTLESLTSGVPAIAFPSGETRSRTPSSSWRSSRWGPSATPARAPSFTREDVQRTVEEVVRGPRAEKMRANAARLKELANGAVAQGGSSDRNIQFFMEEVRRRGGPSAGRMTVHAPEGVRVETINPFSPNLRLLGISLSLSLSLSPARNRETWVRGKSTTCVIWEGFLMFIIGLL